jgi:hypothetical protein
VESVQLTGKNILMALLFAAPLTKFAVHTTKGLSELNNAKACHSFPFLLFCITISSGIAPLSYKYMQYNLAMDVS